MLSLHFSSCGKLGGLLSICCSQASHCGGFSCCRAQALGVQGESSDFLLGNKNYSIYPIFVGFKKRLKLHNLGEGDVNLI